MTIPYFVFSPERISFIAISNSKSAPATSTPQSIHLCISAGSIGSLSASQILFGSGQHLEATMPEAYAFRMSKKPKAPGRTREGQLKLVALLYYIADQKQKSLDIAEQLFSRLMLPRKN